jgi:hypothetical protein
MSESKYDQQDNGDGKTPENQQVNKPASSLPPTQSLEVFTPTQLMEQDKTPENEMVRTDLPNVFELSQVKAQMKKVPKNLKSPFQRLPVDNGLTALTDDGLEETMQGDALKQLHEASAKRQQTPTQEPAKQTEITKKFFGQVSDKEWELVQEQNKVGKGKIHALLYVDSGWSNEIEGNYTMPSRTMQNRAINRVIDMVNMKDETRKKFGSIATPLADWFWFKARPLTTKEMMTRILQATKKERRDLILREFEETKEDKKETQEKDKDKEDETKTTAIKEAINKVKETLALEAERAIVGIVFEMTVLCFIDHHISKSYYSVFHTKKTKGYINGREGGVPLWIEPKEWTEVLEPESPEDENRDEKNRKKDKDEIRMLQRKLEQEQQKIKVMQENQQKYEKETKKRIGKLDDENLNLQLMIDQIDEEKEALEHELENQEEAAKQQEEAAAIKLNKTKEELEKKIKEKEKENKQLKEEIEKNKKQNMATEREEKNGAEKKQQNEEKKETEAAEKKKKTSEGKDEGSKKTEQQQRHERKSTENTDRAGMWKELTVVLRSERPLNPAPIQQRLARYIKQDPNRIKVSPIAYNYRVFRISIEEPTNRTKDTIFEFDRVRDEQNQLVQVAVEEYDPNHKQRRNGYKRNSNYYRNNNYNRWNSSSNHDNRDFNNSNNEDDGWSYDSKTNRRNRRNRGYNRGRNWFGNYNNNN